MKQKQRGALIVEYVLLIPVMAFLIFAAVYLAMAFHDYNAINQVAREAARYGVVGNTDEAIIQAASTRCDELLTRLYNVPEGQITVTRGSDADLKDEKYLEVRILANKDPERSMGLVDSTLPNTLSSAVRMRIELEPGEKD